MFRRSVAGCPLLAKALAKQMTVYPNILGLIMFSNCMQMFCLIVYMEAYCQCVLSGCKSIIDFVQFTRTPAACYFLPLSCL